MRYIAAVNFHDLQDGGRKYMAGEEYPRHGLTVTKERLAELSGSENRAGYPLIKEDGAGTAPDKPAKTTRKRVKKDA